VVELEFVRLRDRLVDLEHRRFLKLQVMVGIFNHHFNVPITMFYALFYLQNIGLVLEHQNPMPSGCPRPKWCILSGR
jgi:hypothetical protein